MKPVRFSLERLSALFHDLKVATLAQLKTALGTAVDLTVFRKLSALPYRTSYSHRGAYYTLYTIARYDELAGGGSFRTVKPSLHSTTNAQIIERFLAVGIGFEQENSNVWRVVVATK